MSTDQTDGFVDNWAYLRTELRWLDQVLMLAVARQRKESTDLERIAQSKADRATSFWWKGIIAVEGNAAYDEHRKPSQSSKSSYHQQLEAAIQLSAKRGVVLALPTLRDRLKLSPFEKNLVLMSLAPEINRRYARLYRYLQGDDASEKSDLPTLDLVLRLMCRNDSEWRQARNHLFSTSPLLRHNLVHLLTQASDSLLNRPLKLAESLIHYLLLDHPTIEQLDTVLHPLAPPSKPPSRLQCLILATDWSALVLPAAQLATLRYLSDRLRGQIEAEERWEVQPASPTTALGQIALFVGAPGTGKTLAAGVLAHALKTPLYQVDLASIEPKDYEALMQEILTKAPTVLLLQSVQLWLGRSSLLSPTLYQQFLEQRRQTASLTVLSVCQPLAISTSWRQVIDHTISFPLPQAADRLILWQQAFAPSVPLSPDINWEELARQLPLSGGEIQQLAYAATTYAAGVQSEQVAMQHIGMVLMQQGRCSVEIPPLVVKKARSPRKSTRLVEPDSPNVDESPSTPEQPTPSSSKRSRTTNPQSKSRQTSRPKSGQQSV